MLTLETRIEKKRYWLNRLFADLKWSLCVLCINQTLMNVPMVRTTATKWPDNAETLPAHSRALAVLVMLAVGSLVRVTSKWTFSVRFLFFLLLKFAVLIGALLNVFFFIFVFETYAKWMYQTSYEIQNITMYL